MLVKDLDFIVPYHTICEISIRDIEYNIIDNVKTTFIRVPVRFRVCELINLFPNKDQLIIDCRYTDNG